MKSRRWFFLSVVGLFFLLSLGLAQAGEVRPNFHGTLECTRTCVYCIRDIRPGATDSSRVCSGEFADTEAGTELSRVLNSALIRKILDLKDLPPQYFGMQEFFVAAKPTMCKNAKRARQSAVGPVEIRIIENVAAHSCEPM